MIFFVYSFSCNVLFYDMTSEPLALQKKKRSKRLECGSSPWTSKGLFWLFTLIPIKKDYSIKYIRTSNKHTRCEMYWNTCIISFNVHESRKFDELAYSTTQKGCAKTPSSTLGSPKTTTKLPKMRPIQTSVTPKTPHKPKKKKQRQALKQEPQPQLHAPIPTSKNRCPRSPRASWATGRKPPEITAVLNPSP